MRHWDVVAGIIGTAIVLFAIIFALIVRVEANGNIGPARERD